MLSRTRPLGVTIIAILVAIGGIVEILGGIAVPFLGILSIILGVLALILAWGLWTLQPWAFWTTVVFEAIAAISNLIDLVRGYGGSVIGLIVAIAIIVYLLLDRNVRLAFRT